MHLFVTHFTLSLPFSVLIISPLLPPSSSIFYPPQSGSRLAPPLVLGTAVAAVDALVVTHAGTSYTAIHTAQHYTCNTTLQFNAPLHIYNVAAVDALVVTHSGTISHTLQHYNTYYNTYTYTYTYTTQHIATPYNNITHYITIQCTTLHNQPHKYRKIPQHTTQHPILTVQFTLLPSQYTTDPLLVYHPVTQAPLLRVLAVTADCELWVWVLSLTAPVSDTGIIGTPQVEPFFRCVVRTTLKHV